jgi:geranylgeranyl diphosphate synthase type II
MASPSLSRFDEDLVLISSYLERLVPSEPKSLYDPVRYVLNAGGKRVRPVLTALAARATHDDPGSLWLPAAAAVELLHTFTLVHDDIMDNAPSRRGLDTVHVRYGSNDAILSGDVLIALSVESLSRSEHSDRMLAEYATAFRRVCEGQALDKEFETRNDIRLADYLRMIELKTSAVLEFAAVAGAYSAPQPRLMAIESLRTFARHAGIAFQINDDLLDLTSDKAEFGKRVGGDILEGKRTYLLVSAMEMLGQLASAERSLIERIAARRASEEDIQPAREVMSRIGVLEQAGSAAAAETGMALEALDAIPASAACEDLRGFAMALLTRTM